MRRYRQPVLPRDQMLLFPVRVEELIGKESRVRGLFEILQREEFRATFAKWESSLAVGVGRRPYRPSHLAAAYIYGAMEGILSSRKLEAACRIRIDFRWLMEGLTPDHATFAGFLKAHQDDLDEVFKSVLAIAAKSGLLGHKHVAIDGTKLEANASGTSVKEEDKIKVLLDQCKEAVAALRKKWMENEAAEKKLFEDGPNLSKKRPRPLQQLESMQERLQKAGDTILRRREEASDPKRVNPRASITDPDARRMKDKKGNLTVGYNMQTAVDSEAGLVTALDVNDQPDDTGLLGPMVDKVAANTGSLPEVVSADTAYNVGMDLEALEKAGVTAYVPESDSGKARTEESRAALEALQRGEELNEAQRKALPRNAKGKLSRCAFEYRAEEDVYRCPKGETLTPGKVRHEVQRKGVVARREYRVRKGACAACPLAELCCESPKKGRAVTRDGFEPFRDRARERMATEEGRKIYSKRSPLAETPNGFLKSILGFRRFLGRGLGRVRAETTMIWIAYNLRIMINRGVGRQVETPSAAPALNSG